MLCCEICCMREYLLKYRAGIEGSHVCGYCGNIYEYVSRYGSVGDHALFLHR